MNSVQRFVDTLADALGITSVSVQFDCPIQNDAQYSSAHNRIQYMFDKETIISLAEGGSIAPLRWTLHEFAHHIQLERGGKNSFDEAEARTFTDVNAEKLYDSWGSIISDEDNFDTDELSAILVDTFA